MAGDDHKYGENMDERRPDGTFKKGNGGRTLGSRNKTTRAIEKLLRDQSDTLTQKVKDLELRAFNWRHILRP